MAQIAYKIIFSSILNGAFGFVIIADIFNLGINSIIRTGILLMVFILFTMRVIIYFKKHFSGNDEDKKMDD